MEKLPAWRGKYTPYSIAKNLTITCHGFKTPGVGSNDISLLPSSLN